MKPVGTNIVAVKQSVNGCNGASFSDHGVLEGAAVRRWNKNAVSVVSPAMVVMPLATTVSAPFRKEAISILSSSLYNSMRDQDRDTESTIVNHSLSSIYNTLFP